MWEVNTDFDYKLYTSPGGGNDNSFQYSCRKNPMDRGACRATVHGVAKSWMWQRDRTHMLFPLLLSQNSIWTSLVEIVLVAQSCSALCNPVDCSLLGFSVHGILQARTLERVAMPFCRGSCWPRDQTHVSCVSCIGRQTLYHWTSCKTLTT